MHVKPTKTQRLFVAVEDTYKFRGGEKLRTIFGRALLSCRHQKKKSESEKAGSTPGCSQAVPHPSTNRALCRLTSEVERDPVHSTRYGRQWISGKNKGSNFKLLQLCSYKTDWQIKR